MKNLIQTLVTLSCSIITADAFTFPHKINFIGSVHSNSRLKVATIEPPVTIPIAISPLTIDQIFEPDTNSTDVFDSPPPLIEIAKIGGDIKSGMLTAKTMTVYRDTSYDNNPEISTNLGVKTPLLFLPGLDGVGNYSANSVSKLNLVYDVWKLAIKAEDRSSFIELANTVLKAVDTFDQPITLVGESFGGLLAAYCALRAKKGKIAKLILINPATSFDRTNWNVLAPIIASTGKINPIAFPLVGMSALLATAVDIAQIRRVGGKIISSIDSPDAAIEVFSSLFEAGRSLLDLIPPETLAWRISKWFTTGTSIMEGKYSEIEVPTLILVGKNDRLLPSRAEGKRLKKEMTKSRVVVNELDIGHALLEDDFIDFANVILKSEPPAYVKESLDIKFPTKEDMIDVEKQYGTFINAISPVFLSRGKTGLLERGLQGVPTGIEGRPVLLVGNHQLYGGDLAPIIREFITEKNTLVRGLAHPLIFQENLGTTVETDNSMKNTFKKFGAVEVNPTNIFELLKKNETVMLFPGGVKEAMHGKGDEYKLFWPERVDFVRMAGLLDAIIVPFSAVGMADSLEIIFDQQDLMSVPFIANRFKNMQTDMKSARPGVVENFLPLFVLPKAPERNYFLFGKPFDTRDLNIYDKKQCKIAYKEVQGSVEDGLQVLLKFRESDPYRKFLPRAIYERFSGGRQAPTAPLNLK